MSLNIKLPIEKTKKIIEIELDDMAYNDKTRHGDLVEVSASFYDDMIKKGVSKDYKGRHYIKNK